MPRISVVVPIYEVEAYVAECLQSIARQTVADLEVVMVDDGSTDASVRIAQRFASRDPRFVLIRQVNAGLGHARNTGAAAASGEYLAFVDSDDTLPPDAYERLLGALENSGSDFATGNVRRLGPAGLTPAAFLAKTFTRDRSATHVTRHRPLLADRTAWNKLFRRSFWDKHGLRFPEGVLHEDIPTILPAHFQANAVEVVRAPVYHWRSRAEGEESITQRRLELRALRDRLSAVESVSAFLAENGPRKARHWYRAQLACDDLRLHLNLLHEADVEYREEFLDRSRALLDGLPEAELAPLPAIDRVKWHLAIGGHTEELLELLRFQAERGSAVAPVRRRGRWYGGYPHADRPELGVPRDAYRLGRIDGELALEATLERVRSTADGIVICGRAHLGGFGAAADGDQRVAISLVRADRWQAARSRVAPLRLPTRSVPRPEAGAALLWSGFEARLDALAQEPTGGWKAGRYALVAHVRQGGLSRRRTRFELADPSAATTATLPGPDGLMMKFTVAAAGTATLDVHAKWARLLTHETLPGQRLRVGGTQRLPAGAKTLVAERRSDRHTVTTELRVNGDRWEADVDLTPLRTTPPSPQRDAESGGARETWQLFAVFDGGRVPVQLEPDVALGAWSTAASAVSLVATGAREAAIAVQERCSVTAPEPPVQRAADERPA